MIQGHRSIPDLDTLHQNQHRLLFANCLGVIEKVATVAPTADTLPVGYMQFSLIGGVRNIYFNSGDTIVKVSVESDVDAKAAKGANSDITSLGGLTTPLSRAQGGLASTVANNVANGPVFLDANKRLPVGVLQVIQTVKTDTFTTTTVDWIDLTGMTVTITPSAATSKILIYFNLNVGGSSNVTHIRLYRDAVQIAMGDAAGSRPRVTTGGARQLGDGNGNVQVSQMFLDSPTTTSAVVYKLQIWTEGTSYINRTGADSDNTIGPRSISTITAVEIGV